MSKSKCLGLGFIINFNFFITIYEEKLILDLELNKFYI